MIIFTNIVGIFVTFSGLYTQDKELMSLGVVLVYMSLCCNTIIKEINKKSKTY